MKNNLNKIIKLTVIFIVFILSILLNYIEKSEISNKETRIEQECYAMVSSDREFKSYGEILEEIGDKKYLKIKKISNSTYDNSLINISIEFQGELVLLNNFMESIKSNRNIHNIETIELKKNNEKSYTGMLDINFYSMNK